MITLSFGVSAENVTESDLAVKRELKASIQLEADLEQRRLFAGRTGAILRGIHIDPCETRLRAGDRLTGSY